MKVAVLTDTHWGIRNDSIVFHDYFKKFYDDVFFPTLKEQGIDTILHLGDIVDRRKYINYMTLHRLRQDFIDPIKQNNMRLIGIIGNHDTYYKNTNEFNAFRALFTGDNVEYYSNPHTITLDGVDILLMPWICADNRVLSINAIKETKATILMGHLELSGFEQYKGLVAEHGDDPATFSKFDVVASGHYHHKSSYGCIHYLGAPAEYTWSDYNDHRGFHIFDTETREFTFIPNPYKIFKKFYYDDTNKTMEEVLQVNGEDYRGTYVKVIVRNKTNAYWFDLVIEKLERSGVHDLQVVEDHLHYDLEKDAELVSEAEDTRTILRNYVEALQIPAGKRRVEAIIESLYIEAMQVN